MHAPSPMALLLIAIVVLVLFGRGKVSSLMGEVGKGITAFKRGVRDGADEIDPALNLIKGGGGALLREKIVAAASDRMIVIADDSKWVDVLGRFPLPIEVIPFGLAATQAALARAFGEAGVSGQMVIRKGKDGHVFVTDGGHWIVDAHLGRIGDPPRLAGLLSVIPGVVEHGLFIGLGSVAVLAGAQGIRVVERR